MRSNKKGISPLIATVLIIGFTVALAAVIMTWGQSFVKNMQEQSSKTADIKLKCANDVSFEISDACFDEGADATVTTDDFIKVTVENNGQLKIDKFGVRFYESADKVTSGTGEALAKFAVVTYDSSDVAYVNPALDPLKAALIKEVEFLPMITVEGVEQSCPNSDSFGDRSGTLTLQPCA
ncbi:hypothetical protein HY643_02710 [Candidatus Woesearchaeota archaeon]|nr:hypothetical protein [Candidatus Woesearchaeota archaeon]